MILCWTGVFCVQGLGRKRFWTHWGETGEKKLNMEGDSSKISWAASPLMSLILAWKWMCPPLQHLLRLFQMQCNFTFSPSLPWVSMNKREGDGRWGCEGVCRPDNLIDLWPGAVTIQLRDACNYSVAYWTHTCTLTHTPRHPASPRGLSQQSSTIFSGNVASFHFTTKEFYSFLQKVATHIHFSSI